MRALLIALLCLALLAGSFNDAGEIDVVRPEEGRVIAALFASVAKEAPEFTIVLTPRSTVVDMSAQRLKDALPEASDAALDDLLAISNKPIQTMPVGGLPPSARVTIATNEQLDKIFDPRAPSFTAHRFNREFPGATSLASFSRVGFDLKAGQAVIIFKNRCGPLCGAGHIFLLQRHENEWAPVRSAKL